VVTLNKTAAIVASWGCWMFCFVTLRGTELSSAHVSE